MTQFNSQITRLVIGIGHDTEDANPVPIAFRPLPITNPQNGGGNSQQPQAGRSKNATGSPYVNVNPLPR